jgi:hypothetical protein
MKLTERQLRKIILEEIKNIHEAGEVEGPIDQLRTKLQKLAPEANATKLASAIKDVAKSKDAAAAISDEKLIDKMERQALGTAFLKIIISDPGDIQSIIGLIKQIKTGS